jgi:hypothetical protein
MGHLTVESRGRAEPKQAWRYIWRKAGNRPGSLWVSYCEIADDQGTGERSGRRCVETLTAKGLVDIMERLPNRVRVYIWDAREVCRDRTAEAASPLFGTDEADSPTLQNAAPVSADVAQDPPAVVASHPRDPLEREYAHRPSPLDPLVPLVLNPRYPLDSAGAAAAVVAQDPPNKHRGAATAHEPPRQYQHFHEVDALAEHQRECRVNAGTAEPPVRGSGPKGIGKILAHVTPEILSRLPGNPERANAKEQIITRIRQRVNDQKLREKPMLRFAQAIVDGLIPERELESLLACLDQARKDGSLREAPWSYYVGGARRIFNRHGVVWNLEPIESRA